MSILNSLRKRTWVVVIVIASALLAGNATIAQARLSACRSDPKVWLSDGTKITITAQIDTDESNIVSVLYIVHAPPGLSLRKVTYTAGGLHGRESVVLYDDNEPGRYSTDTIVTTSTTGIQVTSTTKLGNTSAASTSGYDRQHLVVNLTP
jgi:hypothetical protein